MLEGPYLQCTAVPEWGAAVVAHRKAVDDHVQLMQVSLAAKEQGGGQIGMECSFELGTGATAVRALRILLLALK